MHCAIFEKNVTAITEHFALGTLKLLQQKRAKFCLSCTKNGVFFTAGSWEKTPILVQLKQIFGPTYFVEALISWFMIYFKSSL